MSSLTATRRQFLASLPALGTIVASPFKVALSGQAGSPPIRVRSLNHFEIAVADPKRTLDFYQGLFGLSVQARVGRTTMLRIGAGPQFFAIRPVEGNTTPHITHYGLGVEDFNVDRIMRALAAHGVAKANPVGSMAVSVGDPDGIICRLVDVSHCGGAGPLGNKCPWDPLESTCRHASLSIL